MFNLHLSWICLLLVLPPAYPESTVPPFPRDLLQARERTCFQTGSAYTPIANLRSDVAIVYGIDDGLPARIQSWRERGYLIHVMTGVSWGNYQDYLYGRFDGVNHEDEAQTERNGEKISHGGDVYYMSPGKNYGNFLRVGVQKALDQGARAIHLEEPEFWVRAGYSEGFKREWQTYYDEAWQPPHSSVDAQWRASKLKYYLYRRALEQVFSQILEYNARTESKVRCYVPTHSLLNYAHWRIVSPESSLARLERCDGYIAQVWTGTSRTPNRYRGVLKERTFETAFLEYGAMQNLVRATGRGVWFLNDPIEDNPDHDWDDYRRNWESTLTASLLHPEVWQYEVAPWPERVFGGRYRRHAADTERVPIPADYATELQTVFQALNRMQQKQVDWECGTRQLGLLVSDSLMFQRGEPVSSDPHLSHVYGPALPLLKRGMPVTPVQLENVTIPGYLDDFRVLVLSYHGMKPMTPDVHPPLAEWIRQGGVLVVCDDDSDPYTQVREWWNQKGNTFATPREHLFETMGLNLPQIEALRQGESVPLGRGAVRWLEMEPARIAASAKEEAHWVKTMRQAVDRAGLPWRETSHLLLRRGPYVIAAGLDEYIAAPTRILEGRFINLFDPQLSLVRRIKISPGSRFFLMDLDSPQLGHQTLHASACKSLFRHADASGLTYLVEGIVDTRARMLLQMPQAPTTISLAGDPINTYKYSQDAHLLWIDFKNEAFPRELKISF